jgi:endonuclease/exonuclease/phosphatase family metal-dependent hydrolase
MATITVNNRDVTLISTHLDPENQSLRLTQATEVTGWAAAQPENRIIAGDMNAWPDQSSIAQFTRTYKDSWAVAAANGTATSFAGNAGETRNGRIDYIFYSSAASDLSVRSSQVFDTRDAAGHMPSDHRPVLTVFNVR